METETNYASKWAEFIAGTEFVSLPADVVERMKRSLLDMLGCAVIGSRFSSSRALSDYLSGADTMGEATVIPDGYRTSTFNAAFAIGTNVHAPELAESFTRATMHCGNAVVPAALVAAEKRGTSGRELLVAMAVGYEVAIRAGLSVRVEADSATFAAKDEQRPRGPLSAESISHPVSTFGLYGAAAAAARVLRLDAAKTAQALTISTSLVPAIGRWSGFHEGASVKDLYQGLSNAMGIMAADLASFGIEGGSDITAHLKSIVPDYEPSLLDWKLGREWLISSGGLHFKLHMLAGMTQPAADAILNALSKRRIEPEEVERIDVLVPARADYQSSEQHPPSLIACRISIPYVLSAILAFQEDVSKDKYFTELYTDEKFESPRRRVLASKIYARGDEPISRAFEREWPMRFASHVEIKLKSGDVVSGDAETWSASNNLSNDEVAAKFRDIAGRVLAPDKVEHAIEVAYTIDGESTIDQLVRAVCL